jgi:hypothetical protein
MRARVTVALFVAIFAAAAARPHPQAASSRTTVVLSDLHMGEGRDPGGAWSPREDFRWAAELAVFLDTVGADGTTDLILNGDTFELLRSAAACAYADLSLGCTEADARGRLDRVVAAHRAEMEALARFARHGSNRVVFVPGDEDAGLMFQGVADRLISVVGAASGRVEVATAGYWRSADGRIYAEHGHQIGFSARRFDKWPAPFVRRDGRGHLVRPWGEQVVAPVFDSLEPKYQAVDNVAALGAGLKYALSADGTTDAGDASAQLLRYLLFIMPWQQFRMELDDGDVQPPVWDIAAVRAQGAPFLASAIPDDDPFKPLAANALKAGRLDGVLGELSDDELIAICDYRAAVRRSRRRNEPVLSQLSGRGPVIAECPRTIETRGAVFEYFWGSRDRMFQRHLTAVQNALPKNPAPSVFVWGHTHLPDRSQSGANMISGGLLKIPMEGFSPVRGALMPLVVNGGAWQRTITPVQLERVRAERTVSYADLLASLKPEDLPACYSFVHIPPYVDQPAAAVRYWRMGADDRWQIGSGCGR